MRVLVTGAGGMVGREVVQVCRQAGDEVSALAHAQLDVTDRGAVMGAVHAVRPHLLVHAAAWTDVDGCEADPDRAHAVNALAVRWVAEACRRTGAHLVHLSTDYVFGGEPAVSAAGYTEWDEPAPQSVYGRSKRAGEVEAGPEATVVRTAWVFAAHGHNMVRTVLRLAAGDRPLRFVEDQVGSPTAAGDLAPVLRRLGVDRRPGLHHVTNAGATSWCGFARAVLEAAGGDPGRVVPIATGELHPARAAARPACSVLDNAVLRLSGLPPLRDHREALAEVVADLVGAAPGGPPTRQG